MNNYAGPSMALKAPEFRTTFSMQALHFTKQFPGGMIVVGPDAKRFTDEKFKTRHGKVPVNGCWLPLSTPCPMFMIFDHTLFSAGPLYDKNPSHGWTQISSATTGARTTAPKWQKVGSRPPTALQRLPRPLGSTQSGSQNPSGRGTATVSQDMTRISVEP
jgi:hypothetical protein